MNNGAKLLAVLVVVVFASAGIYYAMKPGPQGAQGGTKTPATPGSGAGSRGAGSPTVTPGGSGAKPPSESAFNRPTPMPPVTPPPPSGSGTPGAGSSANGPAGATPSGTGPSGATPPGSSAGTPPAPGAGSATPSGGSATPAGADSKPTTPGSAPGSGPGSGPGSAPGATPGSTPGSTPAGSGAAPPAGGTPPASGPGTLGANTPVPGTGVRPAPPTGGMDYTIRDGDTFMTIAEEYFGDRNKWGLIAKENPTVDPTKLAIGQKIRLPARGAASAPLTAPPPSVPAGATLHTVVDGDTLASLADRYYGTKAEAAWRRIYDANKAAIGADPGRLKTGQKLVIPPKP